MADIDNVTVGENNYNLRDSAAQNALPTQGQVDDIIEALDIIAAKSNTPYNPDNKLPTDYADDANQTHKFATAAQLTQIETNKNNILSVKDHYKYGNRILFEQESIPTGTIAYGSTWIDGKAVRTYNQTTNIIGGVIEQGSWNTANIVKIDSTTRCRLSNSITVKPSTTYTIRLVSPTINNARVLLQYRDSNDYTSSESGWQTTLPYTFTTPSNCYKATIILSTVGDLICTPTDFGNLQINEGNTALSYEVPSWSTTDSEIITPALQECVDNGAKNLLDFSGSTPTASSYATITDNKDGTYTATKTGSNTETPYIPAYLKAGTYIYSGCPANGSNDTYSLDIRTSTGTYIDGSSEYGNGVQVTIPSDGWYRIVIRFASTYTNTTGLTFKPMLCDPALWAVSHTFKPYTMNNVELTNNIVSINARYSDNVNVQTDIDNLNKSGIYAVNNTTTFTEAVPYQYGTLFHMEMVWWRMQVMFFASTSYSKPIFRMSNTNTGGGAASVWNKWHYFDGTLVNP